MPLPTGKARFWMIFFSVFAFLGPFFAILGIEGSKKLSAIRNEKDTYTKDLADTLAEREQYLASLDAQKQAWQKKIADAKSQYDTLKTKQTDAIANNQKTVNVNVPKTTTYTPPPVATPVATAPKATKTTKTS
ncbi:MAG: hypothetical protein WCG84_01910 [Candidatus Moraniibacteriota bacterium]